MTIKNLEKTSLEDIVQTFNEAFTGYFVTIHLTKDLLIHKMTQENIRLSHSVGAFDKDRLVGFILCGIDTRNGQKMAYNGGTGVIPEYRGKGLTPKMYEFLMKLYKKEGVQKALLEVIVENAAAIRSYEKVGFDKLRELDCFKGQINYTKPELGIPITPRQILHPAWDDFSKFWNWQPTWPNTTEAIQRAGGTQKLLGLYHDEKLIAYGMINTQSGRIAQFGVKPDFRRRKIGKLLFYYLGKLGNPKLSIINIERQDQDTIRFLKDIGFSVYISQYEMGMDLTPK